MACKIMVIEDETIIRRELKLLLENALYEVAAPEDLQDVAELVVRLKPDLVLLDVNLPGCCGFDVCTQIREQSQIPVIFLTSRTDSMDELTGMLKGGDDYIMKPYQPPVLLARIAAVLKRTKGVSLKETLLLSHKGVELDLSRCILQVGGKSEELTKNEMKILHRLFQQPGQYVPRMELIEYLWENEVFIDDNTLSVHITRIREKLRAMGVTDYIGTKRGVGYRI
ncbi:MAG: response regulator transcription factor [Lachnospiraceae bacterium]|nr:response regulator transcription factor [Lachnospiraceae bacterium]MDE7330945.1 response regulator transcription factor [Lachnospiraceae bacterium]